MGKTNYWIKLFKSPCPECGYIREETRRFSRHDYTVKEKRMNDELKKYYKIIGFDCKNCGKHQEITPQALKGDDTLPMFDL